MKRLKEPLARRANRQDGCTGAFWEGRFRGVPVQDEEALLAVAAYIDLNPFAAGAAPTPEAAEHTSMRERLDHAQAQNATDSLRDDHSIRTDDPLVAPPCRYSRPSYRMEVLNVFGRDPSPTCMGWVQ